MGVGGRWQAGGGGGAPATNNRPLLSPGFQPTVAGSDFLESYFPPFPKFSLKSSLANDFGDTNVRVVCFYQNVLT